MKFLVLLLVLVIAFAWLSMNRRRERGERRDDTPPAPPPAAPRSDGRPQAMLACAHCGVHLPAGDALRDAGGRAYCTESHRLAGPGRRD